MLIYCKQISLHNGQHAESKTLCFMHALVVAKPFPELMQLFSVRMHVLCIVQRTITLLHQLSVVPRPNSGQSFEIKVYFSRKFSAVLIFAVGASGTRRLASGTAKS